MMLNCSDRATRTEGLVLQTTLHFPRGTAVIPARRGRREDAIDQSASSCQLASAISFACLFCVSSTPKCHYIHLPRRPGGLKQDIHYIDYILIIFRANGQGM